MPLRVLVAASECAPLVKVGGLGDVIGSLPSALRREGVDARVLLPGYPAVIDSLGADPAAVRVPPCAGLPEARVLAGEGPAGVPLYAVDCPSLYARPGTPYQDARGTEWPDNPLRFALLAHVAALFGRDGAPHGWTCDLVHANDWQVGLAPAYLALGPAPRAATLFTIHNLAFQGLCEASWMPAVGLPAQAWSMHGVEYHGRLSFMKAGLYYADAISTVSPTYAREITSAPLGMGFEGLLAARASDLHGILNGIDDEAWDPRTDPLIVAHYEPATLLRKVRNRMALSKRVGLAPRDDVPLFGLVSRFSPQKGIDLVLAIADALVALPAQLVLIGTGDRELEARALECAARHPGQVGAFVGFDEGLAHLLEASADCFLMPSRFEPCGMNQMYSQRYGTPPIVHATGGLADSVDNCTPDSLAAGAASGFAFGEPTADALWAAVARSIALWHRPRLWRKLQKTAMSRDFSWAAAAARYGRVYESLAARPR
jgi:starch synthase